MRSDLQNAIEYVALVMTLEIEEWWIIGSAAMTLAGLDVAPDDVDVMASQAVMAYALERAGLQSFSPSPNLLFRSTVFASHQVPHGLRVEFMGGFEVRTAAGWHKLEVRTRRRVESATGPVYIPELVEQFEILKLFGRDKDLRRAQMIREFLGHKDL